LVVEPCIPVELCPLKVTRHFRGCKYVIRIEKAAAGVPAGITVDGQAVSGREIKPVDGGVLDILVGI
jgi:cellobiose phosphorylase